MLPRLYNKAEDGFNIKRHDYTLHDAHYISNYKRRAGLKAESMATY